MKSENRRTNFKKAAAWLMAAALCTSCMNGAVVVQAEEADKTQTQQDSDAEIIIRTAQDLVRLSENSVYDDYTRGKTVRLVQDIDLAGSGFEPVPIFCGVFEGDNHVIRGFTLDRPGSGLGLFQFIEEDGAVRSLVVDGTLEPAGSRTNIGGIAGTNKGTVENCIFRGSVTAGEAVGGIVGHNAPTGSIIGCSNNAAVTAIKRGGGIVGFNEGTVGRCSNRGEINTTVEMVENTQEDEQTLSLSVEGDAFVDEEKVNFTGGIAGISTGLLEDCSNYAAIGFAHVGYHIGGIAGYQNGCIRRCHNYGSVQGRKDVGGIVGLFEPYVSIHYGSDTVDELRQNMDSLNDSLNGLSDTAKQANDRTVTDLEQMGDNLEQIRGTVREYEDYYEARIDSFDGEYADAKNKVDTRLDKLELEADGDEAAKAVGTLRDDVEESARLLARLAAISALEQQLADGGLTPEQTDALEKLLAEMGEREDLKRRLDELEQDMSKQGDILQDNVSDTVDEMKDLLHNLKRLLEETSDLADVLQKNGDLLVDDAKDTGSDLQTDNDALHDSLNQLTDQLKENNRALTAQMDTVVDALNRVSDTAADGMERLNRKQTEDDYAYFIDLSDSEDAESMQGLLADCANSGEIITDINGGGIAGAIGVEADAETELSVNESGERSYRDDGSQKATVLNCVNDGDIGVKNDYAGGIAGRADMGAMVACKNYGNVQTADGNYAGGIAGRSAYLIRDCYSLCNVSGNDYAGGIAGLGTDLADNCAMAGVDSATEELFGAVAGEAEGTVCGNCFVEEGVAAINGLTYHEQARPVSYVELLTMAGTPEEYRSFHVKFMAGRTVIREITCQYGDSILAGRIPKVPEKEGFYGIWEDADLTNINRNLTVHAVYGTWITTVGDGGEQPGLLVSSDFYPDIRLSCEKLQTEAYALEGYRTREACCFSLDSDMQRQFGALRVRALAPEAKGELCAAKVQEGELTLLDTERDGSYLVFTMEAPGSFAILEKQRNSTVGLIAAAAAVFLALLGAFAYRARKKKKLRMTKSPEKEETEA